jgi:hypothetical protein
VTGFSGGVSGKACLSRIGRLKVPVQGDREGVYRVVKEPDLLIEPICGEELPSGLVAGNT